MIFFYTIQNYKSLRYKIEYKMSGPRHKETVAKGMAISLVRPLLYFVPRKSYCNPSKNW